VKSISLGTQKVIEYTNARGHYLAYLARRITLQAAAQALTSLTTGLTIGWADVIQATVVLPPLVGAYPMGGGCVSALNRCTENAIVAGFNIVTSTLMNGDELVLSGRRL
jgi:hypothetical protein